MQVHDCQILVVGAGLSGLAACRFLLQKGAHVTLSDSKREEELSPAAQEVLEAGVGFHSQQEGLPELTFDYCVKSPGVPPTIPLLEAVRKAGIPVLGELELAYRYAKAPFVAVTGTNGKTTTTALLGYILEQAGKRVLVGGNIGQPLIELVEQEYDYIVAEASSFQLEDTDRFRAQVALLLNLSPDHLDRHGDMAHYLVAKARVLVNQQPEDIVVLNADDPAIAPLAEQTPAQVRYFSLESLPQNGVGLAEDNLVLVEDGQARHLLPARSIYIKGRHNWQNAMAATAAAAALGIPAERIAASLQSFPGVEHRLEMVCEHEGVTYVNDSKGTNPDSTEKALLAFEQPLVLIAGGYDKQADFSPLMPLIKARVRHLVLLGETAPKLAAAAEAAGITAVSRAASFEEAVALARDNAQPGDVVLLSPACASWDMFANFEARGRRFKELVGQK